MLSISKPRKGEPEDKVICSNRGKAEECCNCDNPKEKRTLKRKGQEERE
jgi:hypothetical protein